MKAPPPCLWRHRLAALAAVAVLLAAAGPAHAGCSRTVSVPVAPNGLGVTVGGGMIGGVYPQLLRRVSEQHGCQLAFMAVPRARLEALFDAGKADLLLPASPSAQRDQSGLFVPLLGARPALVSVAGSKAPVHSVAELLARRELRVAVVRGYDYGSSYQQLSQALAAQGRLVEEVDAVAMARLVQAGNVDVALIGPTVFYGAVENDARLQGLVGRLRIDVLPELPWSQRGAYISRRSLTPADQATLHAMLEQLARSGAVLQNFQRSYQPDVMLASMRAP